MKKRVLLIVAAIAVVAGAFVVGLLVAGDDDDGGGSASATTSVDGNGNGSTTVAGDDDGSTTTAGDASGDDDPDERDLTGAAGDLQSAIARASDLSYHAKFEGTALAEDGSTTGYSVEVYRRPPDTFRRDTIITRPEGTLNVREYLVQGTATVCFDQDSTGQFTCQPPPEGQAITPGAALFGAIDPGAGAVTQEGACYRIALAESDFAEVCFDEDGIPTLIDDGQLRLERTLVEPSVEDTEFVPPA